MSGAYKLAMLLIGLSDERIVTRFVVAVVCHSSLTTAAQGVTCTPTALRAGQGGSGRRTAAALARGFEQQKQISMRLAA